MPNTREKLIELLFDCVSKNLTPQQTKSDRLTIEIHHGDIAEHLIANGVTVQEWISVKDRKPENDHGKHWKERRHYLVRLQNGIMVVARYGYKDYGWWIDSHDCVLDKERYREVTHWMPLPEPPKE